MNPDPITLLEHRLAEAHKEKRTADSKNDILAYWFARGRIREIETLLTMLKTNLITE